MRQCGLYSTGSGQDFVNIVQDINCSSLSIYESYSYLGGGDPALVFNYLQN